MPQNILLTTSSIIFTTESQNAFTITTGSSVASGHPYFANANPANMVTMSAGTASVTFFTSSFLSMSVADSILYFNNSTTTGSFRMPVPISESTANFAAAFTNSRFTRQDFEDSGSPVFLPTTSSLEMGFTGTGEWRIHKPEVGGLFGSTEKTFMFVSRSGRIGFKTTNPKDDIDFKADSIKFRSDDGKRELEFTEGKLITKKFNNRAVGSAVVAETSGSEIVLTYSPGTFDTPTTASAGDVMGTIVWEDESLRRLEDSDRENAIGMRIRGVVDAVADDGSSIRNSMKFGIGGIESPVITDYLSIGEGLVNVTNSAGLTVYNGYYLLGNFNTDADRRILFYNSTTAKRWIAGVDENQSCFAIHQGTAFTTNNDFEIASNGNIFSQGQITATKGFFASGIPTFTGSTVAIDGGTF